MDPQECEFKCEQGRKYVRLSARIMQYQMDNDRKFAFEHPLSSSVWEEPCMLKILQHSSSRVIDVDMRQFWFKR